MSVVGENLSYLVLFKDIANTVKLQKVAVLLPACIHACKFSKVWYINTCHRPKHLLVKKRWGVLGSYIKWYMWLSEQKPV